MSTLFSLLCWDLLKLSTLSNSYSTASRWSGVQSVKEIQGLRNALGFAVIRGYMTDGFLPSPQNSLLLKPFYNTERENKTLEGSYTSTPGGINIAEQDLKAQRLQLQHADLQESSAHKRLCNGDTELARGLDLKSVLLRSLGRPHQPFKSAAASYMLKHNRQISSPGMKVECCLKYN